MTNLLLIEENLDEELLVTEECLEEGKTPTMFIEGIFLKADSINKNKRMYPKAILEKEVNNYKENYINKGCSLGELDHPTSPNTNLQRVSHIVESLQKDGSTYTGRARLLNTPMGNIAKNLINEGIKLGVSSRGTGTVTKRGQSLVVGDNYRLMAIDLVCHPSVKEAVMQAVYEQQDWSHDLFDTEDEYYKFKNLLNTSIKRIKFKHRR